ncbi:uncharacterized protein N7511_006034 [Penicillium nucicola]|uniref:uncharacterized protein n=1 Tax=Penicillium nucicola TaxID=1850975 RepID=UPI0025453848|nr:uncharacterized protein N7511_006034 [Penicillium nucicola]KAJ5757340.1 hypothetical protein N7511_006034 [Penicillium nucicola]
MSMLEALPHEVIEQIFLFSLELNFPRASPFLSKALSRENVYRVLILLAFWVDPRTYSGSKAIDRMMAPFDYTPLEEDERKTLQEAVIKCKWCTANRLLQRIPDMQILTVHRYWINAGIVVDEQQQDAFKRFMGRKDVESQHNFQGVGDPQYKAVGPLKERLQQIYSRFGPSGHKGPYNFDLDIKPMVSLDIKIRELNMLMTLPALGLCTFPSHLLRGRSNGFTQEDVQFLEVLRLTSNNWTEAKPRKRPSTTTKVDRKALHEGLDNAIRHYNYEALLSLLKIDEFVFRHQEDASEDLPTRYMIPSHLFVAAAKLAPREGTPTWRFFEALIRASAESIPRNSPEITQWVVDTKARGHKGQNRFDISGNFAEWVSDFQIHLPKHLRELHGPSMQLFNGGQLNWMLVEGGQLLIALNIDLRGTSEDSYLRPWYSASMSSLENYWVTKSPTSKE